MAYVLDVPLQEVRDLLDRGAELETVPKLGNVNRGPGPCMLSAHGQPPLCLRLTGLARLALLVAGNTVWYLLLQANLLLIHAVARPATRSGHADGSGWNGAEISKRAARARQGIQGRAPIAPQAAGGEAADDRRPQGNQLCR